MINLTHVDGKTSKKLVLYALSTCIWCRKTRQLLDELGADYYYVYVDQLDSSEHEETTDEIKKWNPQCTFPTLVINDEKCITGFQEDKIKKELE